MTDEVEYIEARGLSEDERIALWIYELVREFRRHSDHVSLTQADGRCRITVDKADFVKFSSLQAPVPFTRRDRRATERYHALTELRFELSTERLLRQSVVKARIRRRFRRMVAATIASPDVYNNVVYFDEVTVEQARETVERFHLDATVCAPKGEPVKETVSGVPEYARSTTPPISTFQSLEAVPDVAHGQHVVWFERKRSKTKRNFWEPVEQEALHARITKCPKGVLSIAVRDESGQWVERGRRRWEHIFSESMATFTEREQILLAAEVATFDARERQLQHAVNTLMTKASTLATTKALDEAQAGLSALSAMARRIEIAHMPTQL